MLEAYGRPGLNATTIRARDHGKRTFGSHRLITLLGNPAIGWPGDLARASYIRGSRAAATLASYG
jgi:hypothetical protein